jgi:hypothetical protein
MTIDNLKKGNEILDKIHKIERLKSIINKDPYITDKIGSGEVCLLQVDDNKELLYEINHWCDNELNELNRIFKLL